jgi:hypothetical protein
MPSTVYQAVAREYINAVPIVQDYNTFQTRLLYGSIVIIGATVGYFYLTNQLPDPNAKPVVPDF